MEIEFSKLTSQHYLCLLQKLFYKLHDAKIEYDVMICFLVLKFCKVLRVVLLYTGV